MDCIIGRVATMREDHAQLRIGHAPQMLAVLNNTVLGLFARQGERNVAHARREFAYHVEKALATLVACGRYWTRLCNSPGYPFVKLAFSPRKGYHHDECSTSWKPAFTTSENFCHNARKKHVTTFVTRA
jgi:hypothetical protein